IRDNDPVIFCEHKAMYDQTGEVPEGPYTIPLGEADVVREGGDCTVVAYGLMVPRAREAADVLATESIECEVVDLRTLSPLDLDTVLESVEHTGRLVCVDEATPRCNIAAVVMPKWGLSMKEGKVVCWLVDDGADIAVGTELMDVETDKINGTVEATDAGRLRRRVAEEGHTYPVKALLGVLADETVSDDDIDAFIAAYVVPADEDDGEAGGGYDVVEVDGIRVRYSRQGEGGKTVVLLHGFGGDLDNWLFNVG